MPRNEEHSLLLKPDARQAARQRFVLSLKQDLGRRLRPQLKNGVPAAVRDADNLETLSGALESSEARKLWGRLSRSAQEMMWTAVAAPLEANEQALTERCAALLRQHAAGGTLELDPALELPEAMARIPVHLQPGGYCRAPGRAPAQCGTGYLVTGRLRLGPPAQQ